MIEVGANQPDHLAASAGVNRMAEEAMRGGWYAPELAELGQRLAIKHPKPPFKETLKWMRDSTNLLP
jgi:hypothetical protein